MATVDSDEEFTVEVSSALTTSRISA